MRLALLPLFLLLGAPAAEPQRFGKPLAGLPPADLAQVLKAPEDGQRVRLSGRIAAVCRSKGCWLELQQGEASVHVTFEGYSFFVPKDSAGREVVVEGQVKVKPPSPEEVEHRKGEGAQQAGNAVSIEASGVEIR
jgi:aspartyl/asparaginyl-tRNA synthetase